MAEPDVPPQMDPDFPHFFNAVNLDGDRELLQRRWAGVWRLLNEASRKDVETMIGLVFPTRQPPPQAALTSIRQAFKNADEHFQMSGNDRELQILSSAALSFLCKYDKPASPYAVLAITTASLGGGHAHNIPVDIVATAEAALASMAESKRKRPDLDECAAISAPTIDFAPAIAKVRQQPDPNGFAEALALAADSVRNILTVFAEQTSASMKAAISFLEVQGEELDMLWWLTGQRSSFPPER